MICESCNQNEATIHYTEIVNGVTTEHHLCSECAKDMDLSYYSGVLNNEFSFAKLLTGLLAASVMRAQENDSLMSHVICPKCGMNYEEFTNVGKFGCAECYNVFGPLIEEHLKKLHGNTANVSKKYMPNEKEVDIQTNPIINQQKRDAMQEIETLSAKLTEAVELEDFEDAAKYRDMIKSIKERDEENA